MALLAIFFALLVGLLWGATGVERVEAAVYQRMTIQSALADLFRADVAAAVEAPAQWGDWTAGPTCLILRLGKERQVVYAWENAELTRIEYTAAEPRSQPCPVGGEDIWVEFSRSGPRDRLITMRLIETRGQGSAWKDYPVDIAAALGGDRQ